MGRGGARRREAARAEQDADVEERLSTVDPGCRAAPSAAKDLDDAAVVARLLSAMERIDDLGADGVGPGGAGPGARRDVDSSRARAEAAEREAARLRSDLERALAEIKSGGNDAQQLELLARMERLERARSTRTPPTSPPLQGRRSGPRRARPAPGAPADRARAAEAIEGRVATAVAEAQRRGAEEALEEARNRAERQELLRVAILELEKLRNGDAEARPT